MLASRGFVGFCGLMTLAGVSVVSRANAQEVSPSVSTARVLANSLPSSKPTTRPKQVDRKLCFVLSTGGSMLTVFGDAKTNIHAGIDALNSIQNVQIFAVGDGKFETPTGKSFLVPADDKWKSRADDFIDNLMASGMSSLSIGLEAALKMHPDVIWVVSNGSGMENPELSLKICRKLNGSLHSRINTLIRFAGDDVDAQQFLFELSSQNGGICLDKKGKRILTPPKPAPKPESKPAQRRKPVVPNPFVEN